MRYLVFALLLMASLLFTPLYHATAQGREFQLLIVQGTIHSETKAVAVTLMPAPQIELPSALRSEGPHIVLVPRPEHSAMPGVALDGPYEMRLFDRDGSLVLQFPFQSMRERLLDAPSDAPEQRLGHFMIALPLALQAQRLEIFEDGRLLFQTASGPGQPVVEILSPNGGETIVGEGEFVTWQAHDPDRDPLTFIVQYSADGGESWRIFAHDLTAQRMPIPYDFMGSTARGLFRVVASDGFRSGQDVSDGVFTVVSKPRLSIKSPGHEKTYVANQQVVLRARARDGNDEKQLPEDRILWRSSLDGYLGRGDSVEIVATDLSEGVHVIEAEAEDAMGNRAVERVAIRIDRVPITTGAIVVIDVLPGDRENLVDLRGGQPLGVAVLGTRQASGGPVDLDVAEIDPETISLRVNEHGTKLGDLLSSELRDVNGDGEQDLILQLDLAPRKFGGDSAWIVLEARDWEGRTLVGKDRIFLADARRHDRPNLRYPLRVAWVYDDRERHREGTVIEGSFGVALTNTSEQPLFNVSLTALRMGGTAVEDLTTPNRLYPREILFGDMAPHDTFVEDPITYGFDWCKEVSGLWWRLVYVDEDGVTHDVVFRQ